jgi:Phytanoyl-CoA dioxygenase (PhyH)
MIDIIPADLPERLRVDGFARIAGGVGPREVAGLRQAVKHVVGGRARPFYRTPLDFEHGGRAPDGSAVNGDVLYRVKYSFDKHRRFLALLGNPVILTLAGGLVGAPMIVCWEDLMVKEAGEPFGVPWHQDAETASDTACTIGVYIVGSGDNPLRVIPGSHRYGLLSESALSQAIRERERDAVTVDADPGDLVVHDLRVLHGSGPTGEHSRFTIFLEFQSVDRVLAMPAWGEPFLAARRHFIPAAVRARQSFLDLAAEDRARCLPAAPCRELWQLADETPPERTLRLRVPQSPSRWCLDPSEAQRNEAVRDFVARGDIVAAAERAGVSEEAMFKWLCEASVFPADERGRYLDASGAFGAKAA